MSKKPQPVKPIPCPELQRARNRAYQLLRRCRGGWKHGRFGAEKQKVFLEFFAATCNAKWAARVAGVAYSTVYRHRMLKPAFAAAWDEVFARVDQV